MVGFWVVALFCLAIIASSSFTSVGLVLICFKSSGLAAMAGFANFNIGPFFMTGPGVLVIFFEQFSQIKLYLIPIFVMMHSVTCYKFGGGGLSSDLCKAPVGFAARLEQSGCSKSPGGVVV